MIKKKKWFKYLGLNAQLKKNDLDFKKIKMIFF